MMFEFLLLTFNNFKIKNKNKKNLFFVLLCSELKVS